MSTTSHLLQSQRPVGQILRSLGSGSSPPAFLPVFLASKKPVLTNSPAQISGTELESKSNHQRSIQSLSPSNLLAPALSAPRLLQSLSGSRTSQLLSQQLPNSQLRSPPG